MHQTKRAANGVSRFEREHRENVYTFAVAFDDWLVQVRQPTDIPTPDGFGTISGISAMVGKGAAERDAILASWADVQRKRSEALTNRQIHLAVICRAFVRRELISWSRSQRSRGTAIPDILSTIAEDCDLPGLLAETRERKWELGLLWLQYGGVAAVRARIGTPAADNADPYLTPYRYHYRQDEADYEFGSDLWRLIVDEGVREFVASDLGPLLVKASAKRPTPATVRDDTNRDAVAAFMARVGRETGHEPTKGEVATAAGPRGYKSLRDLQQFENNQLDPHSKTHKHFSELLTMTSAEFLQRLAQRRPLLDEARARRARRRRVVDIH